jgi:hypothetical protein
MAMRIMALVCAAAHRHRGRGRPALDRGARLVHRQRPHAWQMDRVVRLWGPQRCADDFGVAGREAVTARQGFRVDRLIRYPQVLTNAWQFQPK